MSGLSKFVAAVLYTPITVIKDTVHDIKQDLDTLEQHKIAQKAAMAQPALPQQYTQEELDMLAAMRKAKR
jgi:hypothetical protein